MFRRITAMLLILVLSLIPITNAELLQIADQTHSDIDQIVSTETNADKTDMVLVLNASYLFLGESGKIQAELFCDIPLTEDIQIIDENEVVIAAIESTAADQYTLELTLDTMMPRTGTLTAVSGEHCSDIVEYRVIPHISSSMTDSLISVGESLSEYALSITDESGNVDYDSLGTWLRQQSSVSHAFVQDDGVLFRTNDGLMGGYGFECDDHFSGLESSVSDENAFPSFQESAPDNSVVDFSFRSAPADASQTLDSASHFSDPKEAFRRYLNKESTASIYLESGTPITNSRILILAPEYSTDSTIKVLADDANAHLSELIFEPFNCKVELLKDSKAQTKIEEGTFTDYGMVVLQAHGNEMDCPDNNTKLFFMDIGLYQQSEEDKAMRDEEHRLYLSQSAADAGRLSECVSYLQFDKNGNAELCITTNHFKQVLNGKTFDNTIMIFDSCYSASTPDLIEVFQNRGASICTGGANSIPVIFPWYLSYSFVEQFLIIQSDGKYGTISTIFDRMNYEDFFNFSNDFVYANDEYWTRYIDEAQLTWGNHELTVTLDSSKPDDAEEIALMRKLQVPLTPVSQTDSSVPVYSYYWRDYIKSLFSFHPLKVFFERPDGMDTSNRTYFGTGSLAGNVYMEDTGEAVEGAEIKVYRWLNHEFIPAEIPGAPVLTDQNGHYEISGLPYGLYIATAERNGMLFYNNGFVQDHENTIDIPMQYQLALFRDPQPYESTNVYLALMDPRKPNSEAILDKVLVSEYNDWLIEECRFELDVYQLADGKIYVESKQIADGYAGFFWLISISGGKLVVETALRDPGYSSGDIFELYDIKNAGSLRYSDGNLYFDTYWDEWGHSNDFNAAFSVGLSKTDAALMEAFSSENIQFKGRDAVFSQNMPILSVDRHSVAKLPELNDAGQEWFVFNHTAPETSQESAPENVSSHVVFTGDSNVRSGPGLGYGQLGVLKKNSSVPYLNQSSVDERGVTWYQISYDGSTGWVSSKYSRIETDGVPSTFSPDPAPKNPAGYVVFTGDSNVRTGPGLGYSQQGVLKKNARAPYLNQSSVDERGVTWYQISYNGSTGWVSSKYSKIE